MVDDFDVSRISTLTDGQEITLYLLGVFAGALSVVGSSSIVYKVISDRAKAAPHDRLMLGLSSCDIVASISYAMSPFLLPQDTRRKKWQVNSTDKNREGSSQCWELEAVG
jgi:hypothetical protein